MGRSPAVFEALAAPRRRTVCRYVAATDDTVVILRELATYALTDERNERDRSVADREADRRILVELHHRHLPKLADADVLQYDADQKLVRAGPNLSIADELVRTWQKHTEDVAPQL